MPEGRNICMRNIFSGCQQLQKCTSSPWCWDLLAHTTPSGGNGPVINSIDGNILEQIRHQRSLRESSAMARDSVCQFLSSQLKFCCVVTQLSKELACFFRRRETGFHAASEAGCHWGMRFEFLEEGARFKCQLRRIRLLLVCSFPQPLQTYSGTAT